MAERAMSFMPKLLGNVQMVATTDDDGTLLASFFPKQWYLQHTCIIATVSLPQTLVLIMYCTSAFLAALQARKYDAVHFAPGACRWSSAKRPIPGGV